MGLRSCTPCGKKLVIFRIKKKKNFIFYFLGLDENTQRERKNTVEEHFKLLLERMISEEKGEIQEENIFISNWKF